MTEKTTTRLSLEELKEKKRRGELVPNHPDARPGDDLGPEFWDNAVVVERWEPVSVHLKLDPFVFAYFKSQGKGHLTRMQDVLKSYALTQSRKGRDKEAGSSEAAE